MKANSIINENTKEKMLLSKEMAKRFARKTHLKIREYVEAYPEEFEFFNQKEEIGNG